MATQLERWQQRIEDIKQKLMELGEMRPGALSQQYNVCGQPQCRCKDPRDPRKHGPYWQLSYTHLGKSTTEFVKPALLSEVRQQLARYARFRKLTNDWVDLSLRIAKLRKSQVTPTRSRRT